MHGNSRRWAVSEIMHTSPCGPNNHATNEITVITPFWWLIRMNWSAWPVFAWLNALHCIVKFHWRAIHLGDFFFLTSSNWMFFSIEHVFNYAFNRNDYIAVFGEKEEEMLKCFPKDTSKIVIKTAVQNWTLNSNLLTNSAHCSDYGYICTFFLNILNFVLTLENKMARNRFSFLWKGEKLSVKQEKSLVEVRWMVLVCKTPFLSVCLISYTYTIQACFLGWPELSEFWRAFTPLPPYSTLILSLKPSRFK